jgi:hypothetical protein
MIAGAVESFIRSLLVPALTPLLDAVGSALLSTPTPSELPALVGLWEGSRVLAVSLYGLLVLAGGLLVMGYQTFQTRYTVNEIAPRFLFGFLASMFSLTVAEQATIFSNAMADAILGDAVTGDSAADAMTEMVTGSISGSAGLWVIVVALCIPILLVVLLITYVVRVGLAAILLVAAPLLLIFHTLPQTEGIARWWWRAYAAVLAAQVAQSLTLAVGLRVILTPDGLILAEDAGQAWLGILVLIALLGIMIKIPFWLIAAARIGGPSLIGIAGRTLQVYAGLRSPGAAGAAAGRRAAWRGGRRGLGPGGPAGSGPGRGPRGPRGGPPGPLGSPVGPAGGPHRGPRGGPGGGPRPVGPRSAGGAGVPERPTHLGESLAPAQTETGATALPLRHGRYRLPQPRPHTQPQTQPRPQTPQTRPAIGATMAAPTGALDRPAAADQSAVPAAVVRRAPARPLPPVPGAHPPGRMVPGNAARAGSTPRPGSRPGSRLAAPTPPVRPLPTRPAPRAPGRSIPPVPARSSRSSRSDRSGRADRPGRRPSPPSSSRRQP